jgi:hypothetical protein
MAIMQATTAAEIARAFADLVRHEASARRLWVSTQRDYMELWLLTDPIDGDAERRFHEAAVSLWDRYPSAYVRLHIVNPRTTELGDPADVVPNGAEEIPLHPG